MTHATVASLMRTIESLLISNSPMESLICEHREEFCALYEKVSSLEVFPKKFEKHNVSGEMEDLEAQIKEVANVVEHIIQLRVTEVVTENDEILRGKAHEKLSDSLQQVGQDIDRVWKESTKLQDKGKQSSKESLVQDFSSSTKDFPNIIKNNMVGRDDQRERLLDLTKGYSGEPKVIPIVGMGGIGKTTLVREVYNHVSILSHFDVRAWTTVSQQHNIKNILLRLLQSTIKIDDKVKMKDEAELADMLQKNLKGKRYLIVMDDIWSSKVWDDVRLCFPSENNEGSRILLTTRNNEVACYAGTENLPLQVGFMDQDDSWNLFKSATFANEALSSEFEIIGKEIAEKCQGLPLTIVVVAGLLKSKRTIEDWQKVAKDVKSFVTNDPDKQCLDVLGLSYNHLTIDLKACLLYFGIFPEDSEISVERLVRLWMAEGFLKFEAEAEKCLQELIDRCLVLISKKSFDETIIRSCKVHDLIYDMCSREIQRGNVFLMNDIVFEKSDAIKARRHNVVFDCEPSECQSLSRHKMQPFKCWTDDEITLFPYGLYRALLIPGRHQLTDDDKNNLLKQTRSIFFSGRYFATCILNSELIHFKLLKVLDLSRIKIDSFPLQTLSLIWLTYLSLRCSWRFGAIPPKICKLWNLQTFVVKSDGKIIFPEQIWGLMQLRHLKMESNSYSYAIDLPNPPSGSFDKERHMGTFPNIQTISYLSLRYCTKEVISGIQNVKKLGIHEDENDEDSDYEDNVKSLPKLGGLLHNLHQLETLSIRFFDITPSAKDFPATLKKLKLDLTFLYLSDLDIIAKLPNLEVLKLEVINFWGNEMYPIVGVFTRLKHLLIRSSELKYLNATNDNFPVLEHLVLNSCDYLDRIPIEFADIQSLQLIDIKDCTPNLEASAAQIQQEQEELGNKPVDVRIISSRRRYTKLQTS